MTNAATWAKSIRRNRTAAEVTALIAGRVAAAAECRRRAAGLRGAARAVWLADAEGHDAFAAALQ